MNKTEQAWQNVHYVYELFSEKKDWPEQGIECLWKKGFSKANGPILPAEDY